MAKAKKKTIHYIDNSKFLEEMIKYRDAVAAAKLKNEIPPPVTEYIGECFMKIAQRLSFRPNFINYAFKDDMISDGIENCLQYIHNFNPEKSTNPFAYFTQIIYYAFIRRIQKEKKQLYIKYKSMQNYEIAPEYMDQEKSNNNYISLSDYENSDFKIMVDEFVDTFEKSKKKKAIKKTESNLELFMSATV